MIHKLNDMEGNPLILECISLNSNPVFHDTSDITFDMLNPNCHLLESRLKIRHAIIVFIVRNHVGKSLQFELV